MLKKQPSYLLPSISPSNLKREPSSLNLPSLTNNSNNNINNNSSPKPNEMVVKDISTMPPGTLQWINKHRSKYCGKVIPAHEAPKIALQLRALLADADHEEEYNQDVQELKAVVDMVTERFLGDTSLGTKDNSKLLDTLFDSIDKDHSGIQDFAEYLVCNTSEEGALTGIDANNKAQRLYRAFLELTNSLRRRKAQVALANPAASALTKYASFKKLFSMNYFAKDDDDEAGRSKQSSARRVRTADGVNRRKKELERSKEAVHALYEKEGSTRATTRSNTSITSRLYPTSKVVSKRVVPVDELPLNSARGNVKLPAIVTARMD